MTSLPSHRDSTDRHPATDHPVHPAWAQHQIRPDQPVQFQVQLASGQPLRRVRIKRLLRLASGRQVHLILQAWEHSGRQVRTNHLVKATSEQPVRQISLAQPASDQPVPAVLPAQRRPVLTARVNHPVCLAKDQPDQPSQPIERGFAQHSHCQVTTVDHCRARRAHLIKAFTASLPSRLLRDLAKLPDWTETSTKAAHRDKTDLLVMDRLVNLASNGLRFLEFAQAWG